MSNIFIKDSTRYNKDCSDFIRLKDGTRTGDTKYCDLSLECRQIGMHSDWYEFYNHETSEQSFDYFCTGMRIKKREDITDKEVS